MECGRRPHLQCVVRYQPVVVFDPLLQHRQPLLEPHRHSPHDRSDGRNYCIDYLSCPTLPVQIFEGQDTSVEH